MNLSRRNVLAAAAGIPLATVAGAGGSLLYMNSLVTNFTFPHEEIYYQDLPNHLDGLNIIHITDLHADAGSPLDMSEGELECFINEFTKRLSDLKIDPTKTIIAITGDYLTSSKRDPRDIIVFQRFMEALSELNSWASGSYYTLGNHDILRSETLKQIEEILQQRGAQPLSANGTIEGSEASINGGVFKIIGIPDFLTQSSAYQNLEDELTRLSVADNNFSLLLTHNVEGLEITLKTSEIFRNQSLLTLCGHTHGGQVQIPFVTESILQKAGYKSKLIKGVYNIQHQGQSIVRVGSGLGTNHTFKKPNSNDKFFRGRLGTKPEIPIITLRKSN